MSYERSKASVDRMARNLYVQNKGRVRSCDCLTEAAKVARKADRKQRGRK